MQKDRDWGAVIAFLICAFMLGVLVHYLTGPYNEEGKRNELLMAP